ncbi:G-protein coupled receptor 83-like [Tubulanus polymorphus]|uniref:G-protein coupled receptor 83-like n=1 Tax=Tubulanus polymorphus TaxID=672921 RepID=UPI003DA48C3A
MDLSLLNFTLNRVNGSIGTFRNGNLSEFLSGVMQRMSKQNNPENSALAIVFSLIVLVSIFGNSLVIYVIVRNRQMHTVTNMFITNLACSDLLITLLNIPFNIARYILDDWPFGDGMCHVMNFVQSLSVYVSTFTLTSIAIDRYQVIIYPLRPKISIRWAITITIIMWLLAGAMALPHGIWHGQVQAGVWLVGKQKRCTRTFPNAEFERYIFLGTFLTQFCIPLAVITLAYGRIAQKLWMRVTLGHVTQDQQIIHLRTKKKTIKMLMVVVAVFAMCWAPLHIYYLLVRFPPTTDFRHGPKALFSCYWIAMTSVCFNPFIYCWMNETFRGEVMKCLRCMTKKKKRRVHPGHEALRSDRSGRRHRWSTTRSTSSLRRMCNGDRLHMHQVNLPMLNSHRSNNNANKQPSPPPDPTRRSEDNGTPDTMQTNPDKDDDKLESLSYPDIHQHSCQI